MVSVVVPVYNVERYLAQCLDSLMNQTLKNIEFVCVDDGSTDESARILKEYSERDSRFRIISKPNSGYGDSVNIGISSAAGKYIGIIEPDDFAEPEMFETLCANAEKYDLDISRCTFFYHDENTGTDTEEKFSFMKYDKVYAPRDAPEVFYQQPTDWANVYRKDFLIDNGIFFLPTPGASFQDTSFLFKAYACADSFMITKKPLHHYRLNENSSCMQKDSKLYFLCYEYDEIRRFLREKGEYGRYRYVLAQLQFYGYKWNCMRLEEKHRMDFIGKWSEDLKKLKSEGSIRRLDYMPKDYRIIKNIMEHSGDYERSEQFGLTEFNNKSTRKISSQFGFVARWFARLRY